MKKTILLALLPALVQANPIDQNAAIRLAREFATNHINVGTSFSKSRTSGKGQTDVQLVYTGGTYKTASSNINGKGPTFQPTYYVYSLSDSGFVIVSGDDVIKSILGYSDHSDFNIDSIPDALRFWLDGVSQNVEEARTYHAPSLSETTSYSAPRSQSITRFPAAISPLLGDINYGQGCTISPTSTNYETSSSRGYAYNKNCPLVDDIHCLTGCVATAFAEVMSYYKYPQTAKGTAEYTVNSTNTLTTSFDGITFDWNNMLSNYNKPISTTGVESIPNKEKKNYTQAQEDAIGQLMFCCGASVKMNYSINGSGTDTYKIINAAVKNFSYSKSIGIQPRIYFTANDWEDLLKTELNTSRPIIYSASSSTDGGHAFVCDGYDAFNNFHINWGWNGYSNGYFDLSVLSYNYSDNPNGFNIRQRAITGIQPENNAKGVPFIAIRKNETQSGTFDNSTKLSITISEFKCSNYKLNDGFALGAFDEKGNLIANTPMAEFTIEPSYYANRITYGCNVSAFKKLCTENKKYELKFIYKNPNTNQFIPVYREQARSINERIFITFNNKNQYVIDQQDEDMPDLQIVGTTGFDNPFILNKPNHVSITLRNDGADFGGETNDGANLQFRNDTKMCSEATVNVKKGETRTIDFTFTPTETGNFKYRLYSLATGDDLGYWVNGELNNRVQELSEQTSDFNISVKKITTNPSVITPGVPVTVNTTLENKGKYIGSYNCYIDLKGGIAYNCQMDKGTYNLVTPIHKTFDKPGNHTAYLLFSGDSEQKYIQSTAFTVLPNTVTISSLGYATAYFSYDAIIPQGVTCYTAEEENGQFITLTKVNGNILPALTPVIIEAAPKNYTFEYSPESATIERINHLQGYLTNTLKNNKKIYYVLNKINNVLGFYRYTGTELAANKAYLVLTESTTPSFALHFNQGILSGVNSTNMNTHSDHKTFDLQGRITHQNGIVITNGKKFLKK